MGIGNAKNGKLLYHLTRLYNLDSILENGLLSRKTVKDNNISFLDVADQEIISKRTKFGLDKYIPFHFHPYSSFDVAVKNTYAEEFIYICIKRELAKDNNFKILPKHPLSIEKCGLLDYDEGFNQIDWETMQTIGVNDEYTKQVKMAECLTDLVIPVDYFQCIYVKDEKSKLLVEEKLVHKGKQFPPPFVSVQKWF